MIPRFFSTLIYRNQTEMQHDEQWLTALYRESFPQAARAIQQLGGDMDTAKDLFHDAVIIYLEKPGNSSFQIDTSAKAYLVGITKILWYKKCRTEHKHISIDDNETFASIPDDLHPDKEDIPVLQYLRTAGKKCMDLLQAFYYEHLTMEQIATVFNYKTGRSATVQKHKCLEKVREQVKQTEAYAERVA